jgi:hypothetical protein
MSTSDDAVVKSKLPMRWTLRQARLCCNLWGNELQSCLGPPGLRRFTPAQCSDCSGLYFDDTHLVRQEGELAYLLLQKSME